jgi:hypothetical protein
VFCFPPSQLIVVVSMLSIFVSVRSTIRRMERRYSVVATQNRNRSSEFRIRQTALQAGLFIGAFILTYLWTSVLRLMENDGKVTSGYFAVALSSAFFYPLQGFFNFFIYARPRYVELSRQHPRESKLDIVGRIFHRTPSSSRRKDESTGTASTAEDPSSRNLVPSHGSSLISRRLSSWWFPGQGATLRQTATQPLDTGLAKEDVEVAIHPHPPTVGGSLDQAKLAFEEDCGSSPESCDSSNWLEVEGEDPRPQFVVEGAPVRVEPGVMDEERGIESAESDGGDAISVRDNEALVAAG